MDFIKGLSKIEGNVVIILVVDQLSKYGHFISIKHPYTTKSVANAFISNIIKLHGFPRSIVTDRDDVHEYLLEGTF